MLALVKSIMSGKYRIADTQTHQYVATLDDKELLNQLQMYKGIIPYDESLLPKGKSYTCFYDDASKALLIGRRRLTKKGSLDKRYIASVFLSADTQSPQLDEMIKILQERTGVA